MYIFLNVIKCLVFLFIVCKCLVLVYSVLCPPVNYKLQENKDYVYFLHIIVFPEDDYIYKLFNE